MFVARWYESVCVDISFGHRNIEKLFATIEIDYNNNNVNALEFTVFSLCLC